MSKWTKFDKNDASTWPPFYKKVIVCYIPQDGGQLMGLDFLNDMISLGSEHPGPFTYHDDVTHWMPLPKSPKTEGG